jgi:hypothetical protein
MLARDDGLHAIDFEEAPGRQQRQVSESEEMCAFGFSPDGATFVIATSPASRSTCVPPAGERTGVLIARMSAGQPDRCNFQLAPAPPRS